MATDFDWAGFRALVKRLAELVSSERDDVEFAQELRTAATFAYTAGITMPTAGDVYDDAGGDAFWNNTVDLDTESADEHAAETAVAELAKGIARSVEAAQDDPDIDREELADLADTAAQGLYDTATLLATGARYFDEQRNDEAAWEWSFGFDDWGSNAIAALGALHELLWGAR
jgi:hypothetical protein